MRLARPLALALALLAAAPAWGFAAAPPSGGLGRASPHPPGAAGVTASGVVSLPWYSGEPNLAVAPDGTTFVSGFAFDGTHVWRKAPGASSFTDLGVPDAPYGGGDEAIAVGAQGLVAVAGMYWAGGGWCASATRSADDGGHWGAPATGLCPAPDIDRPWIAIDGAGGLWLVEHSPCCSGTHLAYRSTDGGATWTSAGTITKVGDFPGDLFVDRARGIVYEATVCASSPIVSQDAAVCLFAAPVANPPPVWPLVATFPDVYGDGGLNHVTGAVDGAGDVWLAWVDHVPTQAGGVMVAEVPLGAAPVAPVRVGPANVLAVFPWIATGPGGKVGVVWYGAAGVTNANTAPASAEWNVYAAIADAASSPPPTWRVVTVSDAPNHHGVLCTEGAACWRAGLNRDLLDFFQADFAPDASLHVAWADDVAWNVRYAEIS